MSGFVLALNSLAAPGAVTKVTGKALAVAEIAVPGRQIPAEIGKDLPVTLDGEVGASADETLPDEEKGKDKEAVDPALAWLPAAILPEAAVPAPVVAAVATAAPTADDSSVLLAYTSATPASAGVDAPKPAIAAAPAVATPPATVPAPEAAAAPVDVVAPNVEATSSVEVAASIEVAAPPVDTAQSLAIEPEAKANQAGAPAPAAKAEISLAAVTPAPPRFTVESTVQPAASANVSPAPAAVAATVPPVVAIPIAAPGDAPLPVSPLPIDARPTIAAPAEPANPPAAIVAQSAPTVDQPAPAATSLVDATVKPATSQPTATAAAPETPVVQPKAAETPQSQGVQPVVQRAPQIVMPTVQAAAQIVVADVALPATLRRATNREAPYFSLTPLSSDTQVAQPIAVAATGSAQQAMIDMRRQEWAGQMVEQIEALRDSSPLRETRIRLAPESLGNIDVSIRRDGDRVHVHFAAEAPAARQMLTDAQPRLAELAEARGLKLGQTSVDGGAAGQSGTRQQAEQRQPARPASARAASKTPTDTDERIA